MALPANLLRLAPVTALLICLYAFVIPLGTTPPYFASLALVGPAVSIFVVCQEVRENRILQWSLAWVAAVLLFAVWAHLVGAPGDHLTRSVSYFFISTAPFIAISIAIATRAVPFRTLALASLASGLAGGVLRLLWRADWSAGLQLFASYYWWGGGANRNTLSIIAGLMILAALSLAVYQILAATHLTGRLVRATPFLAVGSLAGLALLAMTSRTNLIATTVGLAVWTIACAGILLPQRLWKKAMILLAAAMLGTAAIMLAVLSLAQLGMLGPRITDTESYDKRLMLFRLAAELIAQKPWLGWGPDVAPLLPAHGRWDFIRAEQVTHFHNVYLEFTLGIGIVGIGLFLLLVSAMARDILTTRSSQRLDMYALAALLPFVLASFAYFAVVGMAESINRVRLVTQSLILITGFLLAHGSIGASIDRLLACDRPRSPGQLDGRL
ncbi:O-antigen ligase [Bradyrhizobium sp. AUGA SZCCT0283]|uniref:O-antigen ligase family protein n=1 Tax=Bradyrhizobium sp. AUGA SZCCT0283 TaxID=2807671 RepID=UPI001BA6F78F|nr:O-antigen ligase family protein [Bradyrhizobium sp. AUGA SZCCT0283]MBR1275136.1 O-antigen ligase family protein [Bradyrhizobium sp. AUGA SZCCT0283]